MKSCTKIQNKEIQHIDKRRFNEALTAKELSHISSCHYCREALICQIEASQMLTAPKNLKSSILERSRQLDIQFAAGSNMLSKRLQLFFFSLKVSGAVLCVLAMLSIAPRFYQQMEYKSLTDTARPSALTENGQEWQYYEKIENLTARIYELTNSKREVSNRDKKER